MVYNLPKSENGEQINLKLLSMKLNLYYVCIERMSSWDKQHDA